MQSGKIRVSANPQYLQSFATYYTEAQALFVVGRKHPEYLPDIWDKVHEVYRMILPYLEGESLEKKKEQHSDLRQRMDRFRVMSHGDKRNNFLKYYYQIDTFFSELTVKAVEIGFFPNKG